MDTNSNAYITIVVICVITCLVLFFVNNFMFIRLWVIILTLMLSCNAIATNVMATEYNRLSNEVYALSELIYTTIQKKENSNEGR